MGTWRGGRSDASPVARYRLAQPLARGCGLTRDRVAHARSGRRSSALSGSLPASALPGGARVRPAPVQTIAARPIRKYRCRRTSPFRLPHCRRCEPFGCARRGPALQPPRGGDEGLVGAWARIQSRRRAQPDSSMHERRDATALRSRLTSTSAPDPEPRSSAAKNVVGRTPTHRPTEHESVILGRPQLHAERESPAPQHHPRRLRGLVQQSARLPLGRSLLSELGLETEGVVVVDAVERGQSSMRREGDRIDVQRVRPRAGVCCEVGSLAAARTASPCARRRSASTCSAVSRGSPTMSGRGGQAIS